MSCEIRSMMTSYFFGSSIRMPPIFTNSAVTPSTFMELIFSTTAGGNVFSIPKTIPIFLALTDHSSPRVAHLKIPLSPVILNQAKASHAWNYPPKHPANLEPLWLSASPTVSRSGPGTYPNRPTPAQSSSDGSGLRTNHHSDLAENPEDN